MSAPFTVNIAEVIDQRPLGRLQIRIIVLCGLVALLDGFDLLAIGVAAPAMAGPLHITPNQFGAVFSAALFGLMRLLAYLWPFEAQACPPLILASHNPHSGRLSSYGVA